MKRILFAGLMVAGSIAFTGCATSHMHHESTASASAYNSSELMFAQMMIPHHEQAVTMSGFAAERTDNADILHIASHIKGAQEPEITQMTGWLSSSGESLSHHGMQMDGMLSDEQMAALEAATGKEFEKLYLEGMIQHHQGAISMLEMISKSTNQEVVNLRENIRTTQNAEIKQMQDLLKNY